MNKFRFSKVGKSLYRVVRRADAYHLGYVLRIDGGWWRALDQHRKLVGGDCDPSRAIAAERLWPVPKGNKT